ncbi:hypothetical protein A3J32_02480 [Candidatus Saccharibacteria bacterium RIFCSPLOWO2_02_FULL_46_7]|nr:MAG: hypothetical protein A3J32_02480 [Candidatus Saccharibacteria bacterium RIFCSPLOWO2_02_FULL_46_7]
MPSRNRVKEYVPDSYYHIYNRGVNKRRIFIDDQDYAVFLNLLKRYLDSKPTKDKQGREYGWLYGHLELLAFCLVPNHFHLLIYQRDPTAMTHLLRGVGTSYSTYFNKKYKRVGPLFQERFKASRISKDEYLQHISRYIHLNPENYRTWEFSSLPYYLGKKQSDWVRPKMILDLFESDEYENFVSDYLSYKRELDGIKHELANSADI